MNLLDLLILKSFINFSGEELESEEAQILWKELRQKVSQIEMEAYVQEEIQNLPTISSEELLNLLI